MGFNILTNGLLSKIGMALLAERERWILWSPIALGCGIAAYFALPVEPPLWVGPVLLLLCAAAGWLGRRRPYVWFTALGLGLAALGFGLACWRTLTVSAPVLERPTRVISLQGRIQEVDPQEHGVRLVLDHLRLPPGLEPGAAPEAVRVRLAEAGDGSGAGLEDLRPGQIVSLRAVLLPPPMPAAPGAYDFARTAWFKGLGAVGYAVGAPEIVGQDDSGSGLEACRLWLSNRRRDLSRRIVAAIDGAGIGDGVGAAAAALVTAERGPVPPRLLQAYRDAGLAHILVISGLHMSMVAGLVFVLVRGLLAAIPPIALRYPIKKWTAAAALAVTFGYLLISGAPVPTQRAFIMNAIVLVAVLLDREAISLRSITWAALLVLIMEPEALIGASFQMSFAAVYGLISGYELLAPRMAGWKQAHPRGWRRWALFHLLGILLTTQIAGSATAFYTMFHFNRYATYGLLGNAAAVPLVGFWVMPAALLAFLLMPFGLDDLAWRLMGHGIVMVNHVAEKVSGLPGATLNLPSMPMAALLVFTLGGFWLLLWKGRWRLYGLPVMTAGVLIAVLSPPPDLMVDATGKLAALRVDGGLALNQRRGSRILRESWSKQAGMAPEVLPPLWTEMADFPGRCDDLGCVLRLKGHVVSLVSRPQGLAEDCRKADLVFVAAPVRILCASSKDLIDLLDLRSQGTYQVWLRPEGLRIRTTADWQGERPWSHHFKPRRAGIPITEERLNNDDNIDEKQ